MIKVNRIKIEEFRGIRSLTLDLNGKSYAICGPNGTGKSGVVDALEFGLTGSISRLTGQGRGTLSVLKHGPHVDSSKTPDKARVTLEVMMPTSGKVATITRDVKNARTPTIAPDDQEMRGILATFEAHPEFVLSRREIIKYVLAEPGERAKEVQALLQLDDLETTRVQLQKISNACNKELVPLQEDEVAARNALVRAMQIAEVTPEAVLAAANERRKLLGLPSLSPSLKGVLLRDGMDSLVPATATRVPKLQARADITAVREAIDSLSARTTQEEIQKALDAIKRLQADEDSLNALKKEGLLRNAIDIFDDHSCPVCQTEWNPEHFRKVVNDQLLQLEAATKARAGAERLLLPIVKKLADAQTKIRTVTLYGPLFVPPLSTESLTKYSECLSEREKALRKLLPLGGSIKALDLSEDALDQASEELATLSRSVEGIPDPTARDAARDYLTIADERLGAYRTAAAKVIVAARRAEVAKQTFDMFGRSTNQALEAIYKQVENEFRNLYRIINDDESAFEAKLTPSIGKLGFDVNFYGRGEFPPGAYHSEGHQDAMGLCLYLALMRHILGKGFTIAVLDDVLMSVDSGHRREVCRLLKAEFPNTQFVLTTHDPVWLRHMKTAGLIDAKAGVEFQSWDVNKGPTQWKDIDVWAEIDGYVAKNDVRGAASLMRYYMEYLSAEFCAALGGKVEYKEDNRYDLGNLLPGAARAMKDLLKTAKAAASSWGDAALLENVNAREAAFSAAITPVFDDEWQFVNLAVHHNQLETLDKADFKPVAAAFKELAKQFACEKCGGVLYVTRVGHSKDALRCPCPTTNFTLKRK
jgi:recombinational DNA repair ATPase RecF